MSESPKQIKKHITNLTEFEKKYGEYIRALEAEWFASVAAGAIGAPDDEDLGTDWSADDWARLTREVKMLAVRADRAIKASGVAPLAGSTDLTTQAFDFEVNHGYHSDDGMQVPRELLERFPSQISGLEIKLEDAAVVEEEASPRLISEGFEESRDQHRHSQERQVDQAAQSATATMPERRRPWWENPWLITVAGGIAAAVLAALIIRV